jgi:hypothetical protein
MSDAAGRFHVSRRLSSWSAAILLATGAVVGGLDARPASAAAAADAGADAGDHFQAVARRISAALAGDARLKGDEFDVTVTGLLVTLRGRVTSDADRRRALDLVRRNAEPYMMVYDGLHVLPPRK